MLTGTVVVSLEQGEARANGEHVGVLVKNDHLGGLRGVCWRRKRVLLPRVVDWGGTRTAKETPRDLAAGGFEEVV
jgi:hypothetical protein